MSTFLDQLAEQRKKTLQGGGYLSGGNPPKPATRVTPGLSSPQAVENKNMAAMLKGGYYNAVERQPTPAASPYGDEERKQAEAESLWKQNEEADAYAQRKQAEEDSLRKQNEEAGLLEENSRRKSLEEAYLLQRRKQAEAEALQKNRGRERQEYEYMMKLKLKEEEARRRRLEEEGYLL